MAEKMSSDDILKASLFGACTSAAGGIALAIGGLGEIGWLMWVGFFAMFAPPLIAIGMLGALILENLDG